MNELEKLTHHREAILLAELGAWLHDDFKCTDQQINNYVNLAPTPSGRQDTADLIPDIELNFLGKKLKLVVVKNRKNDDFVKDYLNRCHYTAHIEKEDGDSQQTYPAWLSSPFGFDISKIPDNLTNILRTQVPFHLITNPITITNRANFRNSLQEIFSQVGGDTRRPSNEITLWEWGHTVGALYKAALVGAYFQQELGQEPKLANDLRWRLLSIRTDGLSYLTNVSRLPNLVARQKVFQEALDRVKTLLEETYPLATEVYRDENGSLYVVPDISTLLELKENSTGTTLLSHIKNEFLTDGEIVPQICLDSTAWWGQDPNRQGNDQIPPAGAILSTIPTLQNSLDAIQPQWQGKQQQICSVCGLRPCVSKQLDLCDVCIERRKGRANQWLENSNTTIWLDEVADSNGRLALVTGTFDLANWLDGSLVKTMLVRKPTTNGSAVSKTPSFARLRRVWQTTQTFWQETQQDIEKKLSDSRRRLKIALANSPSLENHHTYRLDLQGHTHLSVLWDGNHLISIDNLSYTATQLGVKKEERNTPDDATLAVGVWLDERRNQVFRLISDDEKSQRFDIQIQDITYQDAAYTTTIPILAEPRTFMALVPADKALDIIAAIKTKYEREMGKVRNRLPLHLGVVYAHRRTPLRAVLDAGRRMLAYTPGQTNDTTWQVQDVQIGALPATKNSLVLPNNGQFTKTVTVTLEQNGRKLTWAVPKKMGDGTTPDHWYPYVFANSDVSGRKLIFKGLRPKGDGSTEECWLVHASELRVGDEVYFTPATFDFEWLDTAGRRFEIAYDKGQRRNRPGRPYLLDDLDTIKNTWELIQGNLTGSQIYALLEVVETRRTDWKPTPDDCQPENGMFWQFCHATLHNAAWKTKTKPSPEEMRELTNGLVAGTFAGVVELYMSIMKQKPTRENN